MTVSFKQESCLPRILALPVKQDPTSRKLFSQDKSRRPRSSSLGGLSVVPSVTHLGKELIFVPVFLKSYRHDSHVLDQIIQVVNYPDASFLLFTLF